MQNYYAQSKTAYIKLFEFSIVSTLIMLFLSKMLFYFTYTVELKPKWLDSWYMCYVLEHQVTRILGLNPGGIWEGGAQYRVLHTEHWMPEEVKALRSCLSGLKEIGEIDGGNTLIYEGSNPRISVDYYELK